MFGEAVRAHQLRGIGIVIGWVRDQKIKTYFTQEKTDKVVGLLEAKPAKKIINDDPLKLLSLLHVYQDKGDVENTNKVFDAIFESR